MENNNNTNNAVPTMLTINEVLRRVNAHNNGTKLTYHMIRNLCESGKIVWISIGKRIYVNYEKFLEYLNTNTSDSGAVPRSGDTD